MTTRLLPPADWPQLASVFAEHGGSLPDPDFAQIAVTEQDGVIVGFLVLQLIPHLEPVWVHPDHRGKVSIPRMIEAVIGNLSEGIPVYAFAPDDQIGHLAESVNMQPLPYGVYRGVTTKES